MCVPTDAGDGEPYPRQPSDVGAAIRSYQHHAHLLKEQRLPDDRAALAASLQLIERELAAPLVREAWGWRGSHAFREVLESLSREEGIDAAVQRFARLLFLHILVQLPKLKVDDSKDAVGLLVVVARRGMRREEQRMYHRHLGGNGRGTQVPLRLSQVALDDTEIDIPDAESEAELEDLLDRLARKGQLQRLVMVLSDLRHDPIEYQILERRLLTEPPLPYADLARLLGPGWTAAAVRQRFTRLCARLRKQIDDDPESESR